MLNDLDEDTLVLTLNSLLASLEIPLVLQSPFELTPSLILAIFESMLRTRLLISAETRRSATYPARVEAMKIFIGVLEDDVLGIDVGLGDIDPRRLADGKREEVLRVANALCWLGKRMNYVSQDGLSIGNVAPSRHHSEYNGDTIRPASPSMLSAISTSLNSSLLMHSTRSFDDSQTTMSAHEASDDDSQDLPGGESFSFLAQSSPPRRERRDLVHPEQVRLHEVDDVLASRLRPLRRASRRYDSDSDDGPIDDSFCHCPSDLSGCSTVVPPLRTSGQLETIDFEDELKSYELRREKTMNRSSHSQSHIQRPKPRLPGVQVRTPQSLNAGSSTGIITRHTSPFQYTLALLNERAQLLADLSKLRHGRN